MKLGFKEAFNEVLLYLRSALVGNVVPSLRAITLDFSEQEKMFYLYFFLDQEIDEELEELLDTICRETSDGLTDPYPCNRDYAIYLPYPQPIPIRGRLIYLRNEPVLPKFKQQKPSKIWSQFLPINTLSLDMQDALLGKVTPNLRCVSLNLKESEKTIKVTFFYDGEISPEQFEMASAAIKEGTSFFSGLFFGYQIDQEIVRADYPKYIGLRRPLRENHIVYMRKEPELLTDFWKEGVFYALCNRIQVPSSLRALAFRVENLTTCCSPDSVLYIYLFFGKKIEETDLDSIKKTIKKLHQQGYFQINRCEFVIERRDFPQPLPDIGSYTFSRDVIVPKTFSLSEMVEHYAEQLAPLIVVAQVLLGKIIPALREVIVNTVNEDVEVVFEFDAQEEGLEPWLKQVSREIYEDLPHAVIRVLYFPSHQNHGIRAFQRVDSEARIHIT